ncbi:AMP-binding protein, partial [Gleimia europaea]|nr:AMP-binding protein [Gleimia europaea]
MNLTEQLRKQYPAGVAYTVPEATQTLPEVLFATAERYPNRIALDFLGATMTYAQLARKVRLAARVFTRSGVRRNDRVGITLPNCPQHVIAVFGALTIGAIVVETNPLAPKAELSRQLRDAGCDVLVIWENSLKSIDIES